MHFPVRPRPMSTAQRLAYNWDLGAGVLPLGVLVFDTDLKLMFRGDGSTTGGIQFSGHSEGRILKTGLLAPPTITATTHDYRPAGIGNCNRLLLTNNAIITLTGLWASEVASENEPGREITLLNAGPFNFVLPGNNSGSQPKFQWGHNGILSLEVGAGCTVQCHGTGSDARWFTVGAPLSFNYGRIVGGGFSMPADQGGDTFTFVETIGVGMVGSGSDDQLTIGAGVLHVPRYQPDTCLTAWHFCTVANIALTASTRYAHPITVPERATFTRIGVNVQALAAAQSVRVGIYRPSLVLKGQPGLLLLDAGALSVAANGIVEATIAQELVAGQYWMVCDAPTGVQPTLHGGSNSASPSVLGWSTANPPVKINHLLRTITSGAPPPALTADESSAAYTPTAAVCPSVMLRIP